MKQWQTHPLKQIRQPVVAHIMNTIHVSHVALQQTKVSGHMVMEASDLRMLRPEADQNIVKGLILSSVASTKYTVNDIMCLLHPFLTLNLVGQGVIRTRKHIPSFVGLPFTFHITLPQCPHEHSVRVEVTLLVFPFVIPGATFSFERKDVFWLGPSINQSPKKLPLCRSYKLTRYAATSTPVEMWTVAFSSVHIGVHFFLSSVKLFLA